MKTGNKIIIGSGMILIVILLSGFGLVVACGPWGSLESRFPSRFHGMGFHHGFHSRDFADFLLWKLDKKAEELDLTDAQEEKYKEIRTRIETHIKRGTDERKGMIEMFHSEMSKDTPDMAALAAAVKHKIKNFSDFLEESLDLFMEFYNSLNDDQKARLIEEIRGRMDHGRS